MADTTITDLAALAGTAVAAGDVLVIVDVSDTSMAASGTDKKIPASDLAAAVVALGGAASRTPTVGAALGTTGTIDLDMSTLNDTYQTIALTGNPTFTTSNRAGGRTVTVKLSAGGSSRTITWPSWIPLSAALPTTLASGKVAVFTVTFFDATDAAACAAYAAQP